MTDQALSELLRDRGQRVTSQRLVINRFLDEHQGHLTAEQVLAGVADALPGTALPTVYATLELFEELGGRADDPVVADRAGRVRRRRFEALRRDAVGDLADGVRDPVAVDVLVRHRDLLVVEDVEVRLARGIEVPGLARADGIERQLDVLAQLRGAARASRLVVDELIAAVGQPVDPVDAPAQRVRAHPELEAALEPDRLGVLVLEALVVAAQRGVGLGAQLALLLAGSEA